MCTLLTQKFCLMCNMQELYLQNNQISDTGMISFSDALGKGALPQIKQLYLHDNQIGDIGMQALAGAVSKGALASGARIFLGGNSVTETGEQVMRDAAKTRRLNVTF